MKRYCLTLDLKNDPELIKEYERYHRDIWPEIRESLYESGITHMQIYRYQTRMFMIMETTDEFTFEKKATQDKSNNKVQEWETLMWKFQQPFLGAKKDEKWMLMDKIFELK